MLGLNGIPATPMAAAASAGFRLHVRLQTKLLFKTVAIRFDPNGKDPFPQLKRAALDRLLVTQVLTEEEHKRGIDNLDQVAICVLTPNMRGLGSTMATSVYDPVTDLQADDHIIVVLPVVAAANEASKKEGASSSSSSSGDKKDGEPKKEKKKVGRKKKIKVAKEEKPVDLDQLYRKRTKVPGPDGKLVAFRDSGCKRTFAHRCTTVGQAIDQVLQFRASMAAKSQELTSLNSTYTQHSVLVLAAQLDPEFRARMDESKKSIAVALELATEVIRQKQPQSLPNSKLYKNPPRKQKKKPQDEDEEDGEGDEENGDESDSKKKKKTKSKGEKRKREEGNGDAKKPKGTKAPAAKKARTESKDKDKDMDATMEDKDALVSSSSSSSSLSSNLASYTPVDHSASTTLAPQPSSQSQPQQQDQEARASPSFDDVEIEQEEQEQETPDESDSQIQENDAGDGDVEMNDANESENENS
jgi:hypothetical protein